MKMFNADEIQNKLSRYPFGVRFEEVPGTKTTKGRKWIYVQGILKSKMFDDFETAVEHAGIKFNLIKGE
jgi:hypothetical protein